MPNRNISNIDLLSVYSTHILSDTTETTSTIDTIDRHDAGINVYFGIPTGEFGDGVFEVQLFHSDEPSSGFVLIPEEDILTPTTDYPNLSNLKATTELIHGKCFPFVHLKVYKRYIYADVISTGVTAGSIVDLLYAFSPNVIPTDTDGAEIPIP